MAWTRGARRVGLQYGLVFDQPKGRRGSYQAVCAKGWEEQVAPVRPEGGTCSPRQLANPFPYKYRPWGRDLPQFSLRKTLPNS